MTTEPKERQSMDEPERPDDSGQFDDAELEDIIRESVEVGVTDPVMRRDMRWMFGQLDKSRSRLSAAVETLREIADGPCCALAGVLARDDDECIEGDDCTSAKARAFLDSLDKETS